METLYAHEWSKGVMMTSKDLLFQKKIIIKALSNQVIPRYSKFLDQKLFQNNFKQKNKVINYIYYVNQHDSVAFDLGGIPKYLKKKKPKPK